MEEMIMNNDTKVRLNIVLQGDTMLSQEDAEALEKKKAGTGFYKFSLRLDKKIFTIRARKTYDATQTLNLSIDAYNYMAGDEAPYFVKPGNWKRLNKKQRLEMHLERITQSVKGLSFTYTILDS